MPSLLPYFVHNITCFFHAFQGDSWWNANQDLTPPAPAEESESEDSDDEETESDERKDEEEEEEVEGTTSKPFTNT